MLNDRYFKRTGRGNEPAQWRRSLQWNFLSYINLTGNSSHSMYTTAYSQLTLVTQRSPQPIEDMACSCRGWMRLLLLYLNYKPGFSKCDAVKREAKLSCASFLRTRRKNCRKKWRRPWPWCLERACCVMLYAWTFLVASITYGINDSNVTPL